MESNCRMLSKELIVLCHEIDEPLVAHEIIPYLQRSGIACESLTNALCYEGGQLELCGIWNVIEHHKKILIVLSDECIAEQNGWYIYQIIITIQKCLITKECSLIVLLVRGMERDRIPQIPILERAATLELNCNLYASNLKLLQRQVQEVTPLSKLLPVGNMAHGLAWSHFCGYLEHVLPVLRDKIKESACFKNNSKRMPIMFYIWLPTSCKAVEDERMEYIEDLNVVGCYDREYKIHIYKITDANNDNTIQTLALQDDLKLLVKFVVESYPELTFYYCCMQTIPPSLSLLGTLENSPYKEHIHISQDERWLQVQRFKYTTQGILDHHDNKQCNGLVHLISYSDDTEDGETLTPSEKILPIIKQDLQCRDNDVDKCLISINDNKNHMYDVFLYGDEEDKQQFFELKNLLERNGLKVHTLQPGCTNIVDNTDLCNSRWVVFLITKRSALTVYYLALSIHSCVKNGYLKVIPVLIDTDEECLHNNLRWVTYVSQRDEPNYEERLLQIIKGTTITMKSQIPTGDVYLGLAWGYYVNYLSFTLHGLKEKIKEKNNDLVSSLDIPKLFIIFPTSCVHKRNLEDSDTSHLKYHRSLEVACKTVGGAVDKKFNFHIYQVEFNGRTHYFIGEYCTAILCLRYMHDSAFAGLNTLSDMKVQVGKFMEKLQFILTKLFGMENLCRFVKYNDNSDSDETLGRVITEAIENDLAM